MTRGAAILVIVFVMTGPMFAQGPGEKPDPKLVERGAKVYAQQKCSMCHSIGGKGNVKGPIDDAGLKYNAEELRLWLVEPKKMEAKTGATRKPSMLSYAKLPKEDIDALVAYMLTLRKEEKK
jgi:mono/diheme cytochrome c family protein